MISNLTPAIKALILDMDGVIWRDNEAIGSLPEIFASIHQRGLKFVFATNNGTKTVEQYQQKLQEMGVSAEPDQIINSAITVASMLSQLYPQGGPVFIIGENGLIEALKERGFYHSENAPQVVVAGIDRGITYEKLSQATLLIRSGIPFYGTNPDRTFPTPRGLVPGAGAILAAIETASDVTPIIVGKPSPSMYQLALERLKISPFEALAVGDRLETDILGGFRAGTRTALVLSGVTTLAELEKWEPKPDLIALDLASLVQI
jgi:4-nitrophenyl phosphatase